MSTWSWRLFFSGVADGMLLGMILGGVILGVVRLV